ncbi:hypothetical protein [Egicoccus sp. AB-alg6-2]|uniref:hypothetical protein n=1 Tax=Egicoccus sp. AB-alg6-2 TaxID=3242692 RepID=UPI00359E36D3
MPAPVVFVVVGVLLATLLALVVVVVVLVRRLARMAGEIRDIERRIGPTLAQLQQDAELTTSELDRVGEALSRLGRDANG